MCISMMICLLSNSLADLQQLLLNYLFKFQKVAKDVMIIRYEEM